MKFTKVEKLPRREKNRLAIYFKEFMNMNTKIVRVDFYEHEYKSPYTAQKTLTISCKRRGLPIDVKTIDGEVYLIRRDM